MCADILVLVLELRQKYFPVRLGVGDCSTVGVLLAAILQLEYGFQVKIVTGERSGCYHLWLEVNGVSVDPSVDCTFSKDEEFVQLINDDYLIYVKEDFDLDDYYPDHTLYELKVMVCFN